MLQIFDKNHFREIIKTYLSVFKRKTCISFMTIFWNKIGAFIAVLSYKNVALYKLSIFHTELSKL